MKKVLIYDLPTRVFHWIFAGLFLTAFAIAKTIDDDSLSFSYHMLAGLLLGFIVTLRLIWGIVGSRYSKFSSFALHPGDLVAYFKGIVSGDKKTWTGHNPASSWATLTMLFLAIGLGVTGYLMASGQKETYEDLHELLANGFAIVVLLHIAGLALHTFRHRDGITLSMIDGTKTCEPSNEATMSSRPIVAILFVSSVLIFATYLSSNLNANNRTLNLLGTQLQLGENEGDEGNEKSEQGESKGGAEDHEENDDD